MFEDLVCNNCQEKMVRKGESLVCSAGCKIKYPIINDIAVSWQIAQEKDLQSKKVIRRELGVSNKLVKDKSLGEEYWERHQGKNYAAKKIDEKAFSSLEKLLPKLKGSKVLVIGCGGGKDIEWLLGHGVKKVVGTDISLNLISEAQKRFFSSSPKPSWYFIANAEALPLKKDSFDLAVFGSALHHIPDYKKALASACQAAPAIALVAEPSKMGVFGNFLGKVGWCTEYGGLKTHRFKKNDLKEIMKDLGYQAELSTDFIWFPVKELKFLSNNKILVNLYFFALWFIDKIVGRWGHNLTMVAKRKK